MINRNKNLESTKYEEKGVEQERQFEKDKRCCANCYFFDKFPIQKKEENILGVCKANPPFPAPDYGDNKLGVWPLVLGSFWCGMFDSLHELKK